MVDFTQSDVVRWLTTKEVSKGRSYVASVSNLHVDGRNITAEVQGTARRPYRVSILLPARAHERPDALVCSCPVAWGCKHVAAVLLHALAIAPRVDAAPVSSPATQAWLENIRSLGSIPTSPRQSAPSRLFWRLLRTSDNQHLLTCHKSRVNAAGEPTGLMDAWSNFDLALTRQPPLKFVDDDDLFAIGLLLAQTPRHSSRDAAVPVIGRHGRMVLMRLAQTGRLITDLESPERALGWGSPRSGRIGWERDALGLLQVVAVTEPPSTWAIPLGPPLYVDIGIGQIGELELGVAPQVAARILAAPPLNETEAALASSALSRAIPGMATPVAQPIQELDVAPQPVLHLLTFKARMFHHMHGYPMSAANTEFDAAHIGFRYGDFEFGAHEHGNLVTRDDGSLVRVSRRSDIEDEVLAVMASAGFEPMTKRGLLLPAGSGLEKLSLLALPSDDAWEPFMSRVLPLLVKAGWAIDMPQGFRHHVLEVDAWDAEITETESGWFDLDMGILVQGRRLSLAPLLSTLFERDPRWLAGLDAILDDEAVDLITPEGERMRVPAARIKPLARTLIDLFDRRLDGETLQVSRLDALRLETLTDPQWTVRGLGRVREAIARLTALARGGVSPVAMPAAFTLDLRPYQREGVAWLQHLREHDLAGILADDMGLGKTAQTVAHLAIEKHAGRLDRPALVVLPTSLVFNWQAEAARCAPDLSVLSLHGRERKDRFADIPGHDLVLTTYALLWRDAEELSRHAYHLLILDEAQNIKNAASKAANAVRQIDARHRLCLTGTPLENHLGELWAQFDFLLPGFLGDAKQFTRLWRTPIERQGNALRRDLLRSRVRPFILRRRKDEVAQELPPKSVIQRTVELEDRQRDLYETVRAAMHEKVRREVAARGFARSQIVILEALLKLRQVCCDPRLVKATGASRINQSAKLDLLMDMLPEMVEEGRRILVFSQFTSMLALIEVELQRSGIDYVVLTGDTQDRRTPVTRFQAGDVPVFLISLKAGGVGLNLTAADTVIHYDPWWNPAAEDQATDRAHRIGQTRPVFVYKLVVAGSIEEKILALQERKADLAASILSDDHAGAAKFTEDDLAALLAPLS